jgi:PAS domain S-box-containing protein
MTTDPFFSPATPVKPERHSNVPSLGVFLCVYAIVVFVLSEAGAEKFEHLHLLLDTANGILSLLLAMFLLAEQSQIAPNVRKYLVIGFGFAAATEIVHALAGIEWSGWMAWATVSANTIRPATWPPSAYILPLALLWTTRLAKKNATFSPALFATGLALMTLALFILAFNLPKYIDTGILGIQRPTQVPLLFLLVWVIAAYWRKRRNHPLFEGVALMGVLLFLSDLCMLYSTSPHEKFTMMAHAGKLCAYALLHSIQMRVAADDSRARTLAEVSLRHEKENLRQALDELDTRKFALDQHAIVGATDLQGDIIYANAWFSAVSGYAQDELVGKNYRLLNSRMHSQDFFRDMYKTLMAGKVWRGEICNRAKDGHRYWVLATVVPFMDKDGKPNQYVSIQSDITARKQAELDLKEHRDNLELLVQERTNALLATEARASHLLRSSADGLIGLDSEGRITFINPAGCEILGYRAEDVVGQMAHLLFHHSRVDGTPYPKEECHNHQALASGVGVRIDSEVYWHADGHPVPVMYAMHPMIEDGVITGGVISFVDITVQRAAVQAREQALIAAENLARMRSEFLSNMSHEIRTPLNGVLGFANIGQRNYQNSEKALNAFTKIIESGDRLLGVVNEVLDFSKIEAGKMQIDHVNVSLHEVLRQSADLVHELAQAKQLELSLELAPGLPAKCVSDPLRLGQILLNLLSNAVKFTEAGKIVLAAERVGDELIFSVTDTGIGMNTEQLSQLFNPFHQADGSISRRFGGTGLGLAISKRLLELMGGQIWVESEAGVGSVFAFRVPYVQPDMAIDQISQALR